MKRVKVSNNFVSKPSMLYTVPSASPAEFGRGPCLLHFSLETSQVSRVDFVLFTNEYWADAIILPVADLS
jgi:hypothetical protein